MSSITPHSEFPIHHYRFLLVRHRLAPSYDTSAPLTLRNWFWLQLDHTLIPTFFLFFFFQIALIRALPTAVPTPHYSPFRE
jgi:hypothetical protein